MLTYSLKVVWFVISLSGLLGSWIVLPVFSRYYAVPLWVSVVYGIANTALQAIFCIGLAWHMDPFRMPRAFCIAQSVISQAAWSCLVGLCAALTLQTAVASFKHDLPRIFRMAASTPCRKILMFIFPVIIYGLNLGFSLRLDAVQPIDSLNCDATHPIWIRLLGYGGTSLILAVPSFVLSCATAVRLMKLETSHPDSDPQTHTTCAHSTLTDLPARRRQLNSDSKDRCSPLHSARLSPSILQPTSCTPSTIRLPTTLLPDKPAQAYSVSRHSKPQPSFDPSLIQHRSPTPSSRRQSVQSKAPSQLTESLVQTQDRSRHGSYQGPPSPIVFNSPSRAESHPIVVNVSTSHDSDDADEKDDSSLPTRPYEIDLASEDDAISHSLRWAKDSDRGSISKDAFEYAITDDEEPGSYAFPPYPRIRRSPSGQPPWLEEPPDPDPWLGSMVVFQLLCSSTYILASISTLIDLFSLRTAPTRLGTEHVALLLATWAPSIMLCMSMSRQYIAKSRLLS